MNPKHSIVACVLAFSMPCACAFAEPVHSYNANGVAIGTKNVITAVDARRTYDEFILDRAVSTDKSKKITVVEDGGEDKKVEVYPFHGVHVKRLVVRADETGAKGVSPCAMKCRKSGLASAAKCRGYAKWCELP